MSFNKHPGKDECIKLLKDYGTPEHVINHCIAVADVALRVARELNKNGFHLNEDLILSAGLLHDIARTDEAHWIVGADYVESLGYKEEADIIRVHMTYPEFSPAEKTSETDLVCLGDRVVTEDRFVGIDDRMDYVINKVSRNQNDRDIILAKKDEAKKFISGIERIMGKSISETVKSDEQN